MDFVSPRNGWRAGNFYNVVLYSETLTFRRLFSSQPFQNSFARTFPSFNIVFYVYNMLPRQYSSINLSDCQPSYLPALIPEWLMPRSKVIMSDLYEFLSLSFKFLARLQRNYPPIFVSLPYHFRDIKIKTWSWPANSIQPARLHVRACWTDCTSGKG